MCGLKSDWSGAVSFLLLFLLIGVAYARPASDFHKLVCAKILFDYNMRAKPVLLNQHIPTQDMIAHLEKQGFRRLGSSFFYLNANLIFEVMPGHGLRVFSERFFRGAGRESVTAREGLFGIRKGTFPILLDRTYLDKTRADFWEETLDGAPLHQLMEAGFKPLAQNNQIYVYGSNPNGETSGQLVLTEKGTWDRVFVEMWPSAARELPPRFNIVKTERRVYKDEIVCEPHTVVTVSDGKQNFLIDTLSATPYGSTGGKVIREVLR